MGRLILSPYLKSDRDNIKIKPYCLALPTYLKSCDKIVNCLSNKQQPPVKHKAFLQ